jgi:hypothetical protein
MSGQKTIQLATLWERTSKNGNRYFSGFLGGNQVLLFDQGEQPHPKDPEKTVRVWSLVLAERQNGGGS